MKSKRIISLAVMLLGLFPGGDALAFYNSSTGRWLSRDPINEESFTPVLILEKPGTRITGFSPKRPSREYGFVQNEAVNSWDILGLANNSGGVGYFQTLWCSYHPCCCPDAMQVTSDVIKKMAAEYGAKGNADDTKENAIKHCTWMCAVTALKACTSLDAHSLGWAHELDADNQKASSMLMDLENNAVGIWYGSFSSKSVDACFNKCKAAAEGGNGHPLVWLR